MSARSRSSTDGSRPADRGAAVERGARSGAAAPTPVFPLRAVAALFIERQHLERPRGIRLTARSLARLAEDTGGLQMDSINVVDRAHYLTAWSRFGPFDRSAFDRLVYRRRVLFEYFAHMACLVPATHLPGWRRVMHYYAHERSGWSPWVKRNAAHVRDAERAIREHGPLASSDFEQARRGGAKGWWSRKPAAHALRYLWTAGRIAVHSRVHFEKRYDLIERVLPGAAAVAPPPAEEFHRWHVRQSLHAMGAATGVDLRMYLSYPRVLAADRRRAIEALLRSGEVVEIAVEGDTNRWLALASDLPALEAAARRRATARGTTLLSPFDSFLWHRERTQRLFGFDYRVEIYTPGHKRVHGYYALPLYHDGHLIGRVDAKTHRAERRLEVRRVHFEPWLARGGPAPAAAWGAVDLDAALAGLADALGSLAAFVGAGRVTLGRVSPARLKAPLARALREARTAPGQSPAEPADAAPDDPEPEAVEEEVPL
ncbi:MAG TPA: crosslink repair DNA glycosylase YcaQ family protein [Candidatus Eisenbacteria bacterium]|jgi:hypothetical protein